MMTNLCVTTAIIGWLIGIQCERKIMTIAIMNQHHQRYLQQLQRIKQMVS